MIASNQAATRNLTASEVVEARFWPVAEKTNLREDSAYSFVIDLRYAIPVTCNDSDLVYFQNKASIT
jgi:hypothetical protein